MYHIEGFNHNLKNIYRLSAACVENSKFEIVDLDDLKVRFLNFLDYFQSNINHNRKKDLIIDHEPTEENLTQAYLEISSLDDKNQSETIGPLYSKDEKIQCKSLTESALRKIEAVDSSLYLLFNLVIHSLFFRHSSSLKAAGGSSSDAIGAIWLNIYENHVDDVVGLLIHEFTHHLCFIDELVYSHYFYSELVNPNNYALSAILKVQRPLDKVIHSIVVSTEILLFRQNPQLATDCDIVLHPTTDILLEQTLSSINSVLNLNNKKQLLKPRVFEILERCKASLV